MILTREGAAGHKPLAFRRDQLSVVVAQRAGRLAGALGTGRAAFSGGAGPAWVAGLLDPWGGLLLVAVVLVVDVDVVDGDVDFGDL